MTPGFLNDNENRDYPLLELSTGKSGGFTALSRLPLSAIVDFGCLLGVVYDFDPATDKVYLHRVSRRSDVFEFEVRCTAASLVDYRLLFTRPANADRFAVEHVDADQIDELSAQSAVSDCPGEIWSGYLVTGDLAALREALPTDDDVYGTDAQQFEPVTVRSLFQSFVRTVNLANEDRGRVTPSTGCRDFCWPFDVGLTRVAAACLDGEMCLIEGYNCLITQDSLNNVIEISAAIAAGAGEPCDEQEGFPEEAPYPQSTLLTGGPACNETIRSINGRGGPVLSLTGGQGVTVTKAYNKQHTVDVLVDLNDMAVCFDPAETSDCSEVSDSADICDCGAE